ncbi:MAG: hypothetical protein WB607_30905 [Candidatus Acidiferrum sp.]
MTVVREHLRRDMSGNAHDRLVAGLGLGKLGNGMMPQIVEAQAMSWAFDFADIGAALGVLTLLSRFLLLATLRAFYQTREVAPCRAPAGHWLGGIGIMQTFSVREDVPILLRLRSEQQLGSVPQFQNRGPRGAVQRDDALPRIGLS